MKQTQKHPLQHCNNKSSWLHWVQCTAKRPQVSCSLGTQCRNLYLLGYCLFSSPNLKRYSFSFALQSSSFKCSTQFSSSPQILQGLEDKRTSLFCNLEATPHGLVALIFIPLNVLLLLSEHEKYFQSVLLNDLLSGLPFLVPTQI